MPNTTNPGASDDQATARQAAVVATIRARIRLGDHLGAYDEVLSALDAAAHDPQLQYFHVLALSNLGCTQDALAHYSAYGLAERSDEDSLALAGRLLKDRYAVAPPAERADIARHSGEAYERAAVITSGYYSAANAATMFRLAGQHAASQRWAREAIERLDRDTPSSPVGRFFHFATRIEACALLGDRDAAEAALQNFQPIMSSQPHWLGRLRAQLRLLERDGGLAFAVTDRIVPEPVGTLLHGGSGRNIAQGNAAACSRVSQAFVFLSRPGMAATALELIRAGVYVHCFFVGSKKEFLTEAETRYGAAGLDLINDCLAKASAESEISAFVERDSATAIRYAENLCLGAAAHIAGTLGTGVTDLDKGADNIDPQAAAPPPSSTDAKQFCAAVMFADFASFSKLTFDEVREFQSVVLVPLGTVLDQQPTPPLVRKSWGDAIHAICPDVASGLELALDLQARSRFDADHQHHLQVPLRIALHFGPMEHGYDPIEKQPTIYGAGLTFASRIEPITPPGSVLVSEAVVCEAALRCPQRYEFLYAGNLALAKGYGHHRVFTATRSTFSGA